MRTIILLLFWTGIASSLGAFSPAGDTAVYSHTYCSHQVVIINGHLYGPFNPTGLEVIPGGATGGMDSIFWVQLQFLEPVEVDYTATLCEGDTLWVNQSAYHNTHYQGQEVVENGAANGCDSIINVLIHFIPSPYYTLSDTLCAGTHLNINGHQYDENNRSGLEILDGASYTGCDSLVYISLFFRQAWVYAGPDRTLVQGDTVCIALQSRYTPESITWTPQPEQCTGALCEMFCTPLLSESQTYRVTLTDNYGCVSTDEVHITVSDRHRVFAPNVFLAGAGAPNDRFFLSADPGVLQVVSLQIFNRWGEPVFEKHQIPLLSAYSEGWDGAWKGKDAPTGVYLWQAELENFLGKRFTRTGNVTLLR